MRALRDIPFINGALKVYIMLVMAAAFVASGPRTAYAQECIPCTAAVDAALSTALAREWDTPGIGDPAGTTPRVTTHVISEFTAMKVWMISIFWEDNVLPALMLMAEQLSAVAMQQMQILGEFLDAKQQLETQQVFQQYQARSHKDYHPSQGICEFGSSAKSLAASERKGELNELVMSKRAQDRNLGNANEAAAVGDDSDKESRIKQFREKFCDPYDNNNGLAYLCEHDQDQNLGNSTVGAAAPGGIGAPTAKKERMNKDIDYVRTVDFPWTLNVDFTDVTLTDNEEEILALANNLYGHEIFVRPPSKALESVNGVRLGGMQKLYLDMRSVLAKLSVAENSFNAITAMKSAGTPGSRDYLVELMKQLGVKPEDVDKLLGPNPSYNAQMEVLTKKIFQNPDFYTNLYDTPANVDRKGVAIQAIGLMQKFDLYKSYLRNEANLSVLLELAVQDLQSEVENEFNQIQGEGKQGAELKTGVTKSFMNLKERFSGLHARAGRPAAFAGIAVICALAAAWVFFAPARLISPPPTNNAGAVLRGFAPGSDVAYNVSTEKTRPIFGKGVIDARGEMTIPVFNDPDLRLAKNFRYNLSVHEKTRKDPVNITLNLDAGTGRLSVLGDGFDDFASASLRRADQKINTKADWSGNLRGEFNNSPLMGVDKTSAFTFAFYDNNVIGDAPRNPKIIQVFSAPGGGGPPTPPNGPATGLNVYVSGEMGECGGAYGSVPLSTCIGGIMATQIKNVVNNYVMALPMMAEQLSLVMIDHVFMIGPLLDAKQQLETQLLIQTLNAEAHKDYHPSETMCQFGSFIKGVPRAEERSAFNKEALNTILMGAYMNTENTASAEGYAIDIESRIRQFRAVYCDPHDNNDGLSYMCEHDQDQDLTKNIATGAAEAMGNPSPNGIGGPTGGELRLNKDIDYERSINKPLTLDIDFTDNVKTADEEDTIALARNLYWPRALESSPWKELNNDFRVYMNARRIFAVENVAHNSFIEIAAMKSKTDADLGKDSGWNFMKSMMKNFGLADADIHAFLGDYPSYYAQMEVLTKKMYQQPDFFTNLMDTPTNVKRIGATMDAIRIMQERDMLESMHRREMLDSLMVQEELAKPIDKINGEMLSAIKNMHP